MFGRDEGKEVSPLSLMCVCGVVMYMSVYMCV